MSLPTQTRQWILENKPYGEAVLGGNDATFKLVTKDLPQLAEGQVLLKTIYMSNDPAQRGWISPTIGADRLYVPPVNVGDVMRSFDIAEVLDSRADDIAKGSLVMAGIGWTEYAVQDAKAVTPIQVVDGLSPTHFLGALGFPGFTAYYGLTEIVKAKKGEKIVISGAAGATGSMAVQIAKKLIGCKVIGIAGTDEKCRWVEKLGADICVNYKSASFKEDLIRATDGYVELYYDNVGGEILDLMLTRLKRNGRVAACGTIANYNKEENPVGLKNYFEIITNRLQILGFIVLDWSAHQAEMTNLFIEEVKKGTLLVGDENETVVDTAFEDVPKTWMMLFSGGNTGKLVTKLN